MSIPKESERRRWSLHDLILARFEHFLAVLVFSSSIIVIVVALAAPISDTSLPLAVIQGMSVVVSAVIGFYFGNKGAERAEERVREVENQLAGGGTLAIQQQRIGSELNEILMKQKMVIELAQKASDLHVKNQKIEADRNFRDVDEMNEDCYNAMKAWIYGNHAYLKLDQDKPLYDEILDMFKKSQESRNRTDFPDNLFPKRTYLGKAVAQIWLDDDENAIQSLNSVGKDIAKMKDLFDADDVKVRDIDKFLKSSFVHQLNVNVKEYLEKARLENEQKK